MLQLSQSAFNRATEYIAENARPLDRAQFEYHFGSRAAADVVTELARFQNDDGGFGHGIEPDVRMPFSSPFATSVGFQVLRELEVPGDEAVVRDGIAYFERTFDPAIGGWDPVGPRSDDFLHAPWWSYEPFEGTLDPLKRANPGAEIAGYLHSYAGLTSSDTVDSVTAMALGAFDELPDAMEVHTMMCFMRLAEMAPGQVAEHLLPKLRRGVHLVTGQSPADWQNYGGRPLWFAPNPGSLLADELKDPIQVQLDHEIATQADDGSWKAFWSYGPLEAELELAKAEWAGYLTLRNLLALDAWGRI